MGGRVVNCEITLSRDEWRRMFAWAQEDVRFFGREMRYETHPRQRLVLSDLRAGKVAIVELEAQLDDGPGSDLVTLVVPRDTAIPLSNLRGCNACTSVYRQMMQQISAQHQASRGRGFIPSRRPDPHRW